TMFLRKVATLPVNMSEQSPKPKFSPKSVVSLNLLLVRFRYTIWCTPDDVALYVLVFWNSLILVLLCSLILVFWYSFILVFWYSFILVFDIALYLYFDIALYLYFGVRLMVFGQMHFGFLYELPISLQDYGQPNHVWCILTAHFLLRLLFLFMFLFFKGNPKTRPRKDQEKTKKNPRSINAILVSQAFMSQTKRRGSGKTKRRGSSKTKPRGSWRMC